MHDRGVGAPGQDVLVLPRRLGPATRHVERAGVLRLQARLEARRLGVGGEGPLPVSAAPQRVGVDVLVLGVLGIGGHGRAEAGQTLRQVPRVEQQPAGLVVGRARSRSREVPWAGRPPVSRSGRGPGRAAPGPGPERRSATPRHPGAPKTTSAATAIPEAAKEEGRATPSPGSDDAVPSPAWAPSSDSLQRAQNSQVGRFRAPHFGQTTACFAFMSTRVHPSQPPVKPQLKGGKPSRGRARRNVRRGPTLTGRAPWRRLAAPTAGRPSSRTGPPAAAGPARAS